jgi:hypothetical protein
MQSDQCHRGLFSCRALAAGSVNPIVYVDVDAKVRANPQYEQAELVAVLGALRAIYVVIIS